MELKKLFLRFRIQREQSGYGAITLTKVLQNAIKMKASYQGGLLR